MSPTPAPRPRCPQAVQGLLLPQGSCHADEFCVTLMAEDDPAVTPCHPPALACQREGEPPNQFWDSWWDRDRTVGSRRDSFFMPGMLSCCHPVVTSGASPGSGGWQRHSGGGGRGAAAAAVRSEPEDSRRSPGGCAEPGGSEEHADPPGSRLALPPAGGTDGGTAGCLKDVPDVILVPGRAFHVGHGADLPGHGLSLRGHAESDSAGTPLSHYPMLGTTPAPFRPTGR